MKQCHLNRFWNGFVLGALVLLVVGSAICTVAASAASHPRAAAPAATAAR